MLATADSLFEILRLVIVLGGGALQGIHFPFGHKEQGRRRTSDLKTPNEKDRQISNSRPFLNRFPAIPERRYRYQLPTARVRVHTTHDCDARRNLAALEIFHKFSKILSFQVMKRVALGEAQISGETSLPTG